MSLEDDRIEASLPSALPHGERMLWRGGPDGALLARHALHLRKVALYFALLLAWRLGLVWRDGSGWDVAVSATLTTAALALVTLAALRLYAGWSARATTYSITTHRVIVQTGVALPITVNLPYALVDQADLVHRGGDAGDIVLRLQPGKRAAYLILWPSVQPFHLMHPRPMLRALAEVNAPAEALGEALAAYAVRPDALPRSEPGTNGREVAGAAAVTT